MYGYTGKEMGCFLLVVAAIGGLMLIGAEHLIGWLWLHLSVGWK